MRKKEKAESQTAVHTLIFILIGIIILIIVTGIILVNKTNIIDGVQARISELSASSDEEGLESEEEEESVVDSSITDGYYDEENKVTWHVEADGSMCPIPDGYVGSEATGENGISTGYVIYEGTKAVTDENVDDAKTTRNQYVWIPVDDPSELYGTDSNGKKWGKLYNFATSSDDENYDEETGTYPLNWSESNGVMSITRSSNYREPDIVSYYDTDSRLITLGLGAETTHEFLIQLEQEFNSMIESVEKYGGFYIGRYETGKSSQDIAVVVQMDTDINYQTWYTMYSKCKTLSGDNENVVTGMIWGCQWDRVLMWLIESKNKTIEEICVDSTGWGNFYVSSFEYINGNRTETVKNANSFLLIPTGSTEYTKANNIYDLAGNVREYTMVASGNNNRISRGSYIVSGINNNAYVSYYYGQPLNLAYNNSGCRATLYIK